MIMNFLYLPYQASQVQVQAHQTDQVRDEQDLEQLLAILPSILALCVPHEKYEGDQEAEWDQHGQAHLLAIIDASVLRSQTVDDDVGKNGQADDPEGNDQNEEADLIAAVETLRKQEEESEDAQRN